MDKLKNNILFGLIGVFLLIYLITRAILLPVTIDEGGTFFNAVPRSVTDIVTYNDPSPNNHILNTLLIKLFINLFGVHSFVLRLPNILAFVLYYVVSILWLKRLQAGTLFLLFGIVVLNCNPYLLDFFSLARGYALSMSFMFTSMYLIFRFYENSENKYLNLSFVFAALATYSNFTVLNFYIALAIFVSIWLILRHWNSSLRSFIVSIAIPFVISVFLCVLCYLPMKKIIATGQLQYWNSNGLYRDTILPLLEAIKYGVNVWNFGDGWLFPCLFILITCVMGIFILYRFYIKQTNGKQDFLFFSFCICILTFVVIQLENSFFGVPFLNARGANFLYVLFCIPFIYGVHVSLSYFRKPVTMLITCVLIAGSVHFISALNLYSCYEWWFDADTKKVLSFISEEEKENNTKVRLNTYWLYNPSFQFHVEEHPYSKIELAPFHMDLWPDSNYTYYYCERDKMDELLTNYKEVVSFNHRNNVLLKRIK